MPKIFLKPNSAEFADSDKKPAGDARKCDMPGCHITAEHRAPKSRDLDDYYWFCFEHVQEYNKAWDFFSGMAQQDIENHIIRSMMWDRPTWRFSDYKDLEEKLRARASRFSHDGAASGGERNDTEDEINKRYRFSIPPNTPEYEALSILGMAPPLTPERIKARYKELVKKHHPDVNKGDKQSEDLLKRINMAYTILKLAHEKFAAMGYEDI